MLNARGALISEQRKSRFEARGQLTPRERLARLLDPGMPFLTVGNLAGYLLDTSDPDKSIPGSTMISGIGFISGVRCMVVVDDSGIQAGRSPPPAVTACAAARKSRCNKSCPSCTWWRAPAAT